MEIQEQQQSRVIAGEFVPEHNMIACGTLPREDGRTQAVILSALPVLRPKGGAFGIVHSKHFFLGLPPSFDTEIIGVPWSSEQMAVEAMQTNDVKLLEYMAERY